MRQTIILALLLLSVSLQASAKHFDIFSSAQIRALIGDFPARGSTLEALDFEEMLRLQDTRTAKECAEAKAEENSTFEVMFAGPKGPLTKAEAKKHSLTVLRFYAEGLLNITNAKKLYKRPRPYLTNTNLKPCVDLESSYAYPSGHTTMSRTFAHMLSAIYPARKDAFFERADEVAHNRVLGGVHHPSDIVAGKKLGDAIADKIVASARFKHFLINN